MFVGCAKKYLLATIKLMCILSVLNFPLLAGDTDTATATGSLSPKTEQNQTDINPSQDLAQKPEPFPNDTSTVIIPTPHETVHNTENDSNAELSNNIDIEELKHDTQVNPAENIDTSENTEDMGNNANTEDKRPIDEMQDTNEKDAASEDIATEEKTDNSRINDIAAYQLELNNIYRHREDKVAYLTFDDGPTPSITPAILDILSKEGVKATFFVIGSNAERHPDLVGRIYQEGHGIGNHSYSHVFKHIYASTQNYLDELAKTKQILQSILGEDKTFMLTRFPGGSFGEKLAPFREAVNKAGYLYVDWNCVNGDAETSKPQTVNQLIQRFKDTAKGMTSLVILMHDAPKKDTTVQALPHIIRYLKSENYKLELLPWSR